MRERISKQRPRWLPWLVGLASLMLVLVAALPYAFGCREDCFTRKGLSDTAKRVIRQGRITTQGENAYVDAELSKQTNSLPGSYAISQTTIETASVPVDVKTFRLTKDQPYPLGAGNLTTVKDNLLVIDRLGQIYRYDSGRLVKIAPPVPNGLRDFVARSLNMTLNVDTLRTHSIAFDSVEQRLYASYEKYISPSQNRYEIASITLDPDTLTVSDKWRVEYSTESFSSSTWGLAGGGKLLINDRTLYFAVGDYGFYGRAGYAQEHAAQDLKRPFGKIFAMDLTSHKVRNVSIGHRNTQGLVVSTEGKLLNVEQGPQGGDEVNLVRPGRNYGWPIQTFGADYGTYTWHLAQNPGELVVQPPLFAFVPSVATSSIVQLKGWYPRWEGDFLVGSLKAQSLYRLHIVEDRVVFSEPIWIGHRIRDIAQINSVLYLLTDDGLMLELRADAKLVKRDTRGVDAVPISALTKCLGCHHLGETNPMHLAPSLSNLTARDVASDNFERYSAALKGVGGKWTRERLEKFLENPAAFAPGTVMPKPELTRKEMNAIVELIAKEDMKK